jgi:nanoRNase/pAp phosphatase (c-di-AMP/oligoRNAs hydrolase)
MESFESLVAGAEKILVMGHQTPDYDAYASALLVKGFIEKRFPAKNVRVLFDVKSPFTRLSHLAGYDSIVYDTLCEQLETFNPDLVIFVDGNEVSRFSKEESSVSALLASRKIVIFDHHVLVNKNADFIQHDIRNSCVEVIYHYFAGAQQWEKFPGWEELFLTGFIGDSYRFYYETDKYRDTFQVVADILDNGYSIRAVSDNLFGYTPESLMVLGILMPRITYEKEYCYSYMTMEEYEQKLKGVIDANIYKQSRRYFIDEILNKVYGYDLSFILCPDSMVDDGKTYSGSFRTKENTIDTTVLAKYLGGGGHVGGSGFNVVADTMEEALATVKTVIAEHLSEAHL